MGVPGSVGSPGTRFLSAKVPEKQLPLKTAQHFPKLSHSLHIFLCHVRYHVKIQTLTKAFSAALYLFKLINKSK